MARASDETMLSETGDEKLNNSQRYNLVLKQLKVKHDYEDFLAIINEQYKNDAARRNELIEDFNQQLDALIQFINLLKQQDIYSRKLIINWYKLFEEPQLVGKTITKALSESTHCYSCYKGYLILIINLISLALNYVSIIFSHNQQKDIDFGTGMGKTTLGIVDDLITGGQLIFDGEVAIGSLNIFKSIQSLAILLTQNIGYSALNSIPASSVPIMGAVSALVGIAIGFVIETLQIRKAKEQINKIQTMLKETDNSNERNKLNELLLVEYANIASHQQQIKTLAITTVAVITITALSFTVLGGITFGAVPIAGLILAGVLFAIQLYRASEKKVNNPDKRLALSKKIETKVTEPGMLSVQADIVSTWNKLVDELINQQGILRFRGPSGDIVINFLQNTGPKSGILQNQGITLKTYVDKLFIKHPPKAKAVIEAIKQKDYSALKTALAIRQTKGLGFLTKPTFGIKVLESVSTPVAVEPKPQPQE